MTQEEIRTLLEDKSFNINDRVYGLGRNGKFQHGKGADIKYGTYTISCSEENKCVLRIKGGDDKVGGEYRVKIILEPLGNKNTIVLE